MRIDTDSHAPTTEQVVVAIRRLNRSYPALNRYGYAMRVAVGALPRDRRPGDPPAMRAIAAIEDLCARAAAVAPTTHA